MLPGCCCNLLVPLDPIGTQASETAHGYVAEDIVNIKIGKVVSQPHSFMLHH